MRNKGCWISVTLEELPIVLENIKEAKGFADHFGLDMEFVQMRVKTSLRGAEVSWYAYEVFVPKHVWDNLEHTSLKERLFVEP